MPRISRLAIALVVTAFAPPAGAHASGFALFQHGGRATAQAGAFTARAADPSAVSYNAAAIARLDGLQVQLGLDFDVPRDAYEVGREHYAAEHHIDLPPATYLTWHPARDSRWAFGLGLDSPVWHRQSWPPPIFRRAIRFDVEVLGFHPVTAFAIDKRWSVGAGVRYLSGRLRDDYEAILDSGRNPNTFWVTGERSAEAEVDGWAADLSVLFRDLAWGFGAAFSSGATLHGTADVELRVRHFGLPGAPRAATSIAYLLEEAPRGLGIDLAPEVRAGAWIAPDPRLRLELDVALALWSKADWDRPREIPLCGAPCHETLPRNWRDTLSFRLGAERDITPQLRLAAGAGYEPSTAPVPTYTPQGSLELFVPQGDAWVYAVGASYSSSKVSFDLGYSLHDHRRRPDRFGGRYSSSRQIFAISTRWRF